MVCFAVKVIVSRLDKEGTIKVKWFGARFLIIKVACTSVRNLELLHVSSDVGCGLEEWAKAVTRRRFMLHSFQVDRENQNCWWIGTKILQTRPQVKREGVSPRRKVMIER